MASVAEGEGLARSMGQSPFALARGQNFERMLFKKDGERLREELVRKGVVPDGDKVMRMHAQTAMIENGFVFLPETAPWLAVYLHELTTFPASKHDDQADSTSQFLNWFKEASRVRSSISPLIM